MQAAGIVVYFGYQSSMRYRLAALGRIVGILVLLCAVACAQAVSLAEIHAHVHNSQHCCGLCHAGPLAFVPISMDTTGLPSLAVIGVAYAEDGSGVRDPQADTASSRAPPA